jgi:hypothetical protein
MLIEAIPGKYIWRGGLADGFVGSGICSMERPPDIFGDVGSEVQEY